MTFEYPSVTVLGSTGSVGEQAMDVAEKCGLRVNALCAHKNVKRVEEQARKFHIKACAMSDEDSAKALKISLADTDIKVYSGESGICEMIAVPYEKNEVVLNSIIGEAGLKSTLTTLQSDKKLALANKESLVCAGEIVMKTAKEHHQTILPVDSEHSAIFQSLRAGSPSEIKKILLTASGGPFYGYTRDRLKDITPERALAHPTWKMGAKITVDSATLMNKGFEVIEAVHLFGVKAEQVQVLVHRESVLHSAVQYKDNAVIGQMSVPDMRFCVQYALTHPQRADGVIEPLDLVKIGKLTFSEPDTETFPLLALAQKAIGEGGALPCVINAANEVAVSAFLNKHLSFTGIFDVVCKTAETLSYAKDIHDLDGIFVCDKEARQIAKQFTEALAL